MFVRGLGAAKRYSLSFISERVQQVFRLLDSKGDGVLDAEELEAHLWSVGYKVTEAEVELMIWEADDRRTGVMTLPQLVTIMNRWRTSGKRPPATGSTLLLSLVEFTMFDVDDSAAIQMDEVQQMLYVYYGLSGKELDRHVEEFRGAFAKLPPRPSGRSAGEISFSEFMRLIHDVAPRPRADLQVPLGGVDDVINVAPKKTHHQRRPWREARSPLCSPRSPSGSPRRRQNKVTTANFGAKLVKQSSLKLRLPPKAMEGPRRGGPRTGQRRSSEASFAVPMPPTTPSDDVMCDSLYRIPPPRRCILPKLVREYTSIMYIVASPPSLVVPTLS